MSENQNEFQAKNQKVGGMLVLSRLMIALDNWKCSWGISNQLKITKSVHQTDDKCKQHGGIETDRENHGARNSDPWLFDLIT